MRYTYAYIWSETRLFLSFSLWKKMRMFIYNGKVQVLYVFFIICNCSVNHFEILLSFSISSFLEYIRRKTFYSLLCKRIFSWKKRDYYKLKLHKTGSNFFCSYITHINGLRLKRENQVFLNFLFCCLKYQKYILSF